MWLDWGTRLITILALFIILAGLLVLGLPDRMEGQKIIELDATHSLHLADLVGSGMLILGIVTTWATVLAWQRKRIDQ